MGNSLQNKIALVTGARTGIGLGIAKRFVSDGAQVVITGRRQTEPNAAVAEIEHPHGCRENAAWPPVVVARSA
jgi:NAD(P)-dependent dehydrogenase (short-subunit alcohol dehydrogenase family)